jgi:hypothetical protein
MWENNNLITAYEHFIKTHQMSEATGTNNNTWSSSLSVDAAEIGIADFITAPEYLSFSSTTTGYIATENNEDLKKDIKELRQRIIALEQQLSARSTDIVQIEHRKLAAP